MARRSITLAPVVESIVRLFQTKLMTRLDQDISFTEALNAFLISAIVKDAAAYMERELSPEQARNLLQAMNLELDSILDAVQDAALRQALKPVQQQVGKAG